jgi:hypothetical protein
MLDILECYIASRPGPALIATFSVVLGAALNLEK